jgi:O-methyltransferase
MSSVVRTAQRRVRRSLSKARDAVVGRRVETAIDTIARFDPRWPVFASAVDFVATENIPGDIVECGVFTGLSLALFSHAHQRREPGTPRQVVGFDAFEGLPPSTDEHPMWKTGSLGVNAWDHPLLEIGERVTPDATRRLFAACGLPEPRLEVGWFADTLRATVPASIAQIAVLHVDCDLYESTRDVLAGVLPALQDGTMVLFDDWFLFKGNPSKGESRAFGEFLASHHEWEAVPYRTYGTCGRAVILSHR